MATPAPASEPSVPTPPNAPAVPPPAPVRRPNRVPLYVAVGAVAVVVLLLLILVAAPMLTGSGKGGSTPVDMTYAHAKPIADAAMANYRGGGWVPVVASGIAPENSTVVALNATSVAPSTNCTLNANAGAPSSLTVPAYNGTRTSGVAPLWDFIYKNVTGVAAIVVVLNGQATVIGTISGGVCASLFAFLSPIPSNVIDSSQVAAAVAGAAATFLASYPNASTVYALLGGFNFGVISSGPQWSVIYTTCSPGATGSVGVGAQFNATVNATTGRVISNQTTTGVSCSSGSRSPIGSVFGFGTVQQTSSTPNNQCGASPPAGNCFAVGIASASSSVTTANVTFSVQSGGTPVTLGAGANVTLVGITGKTLAMFTFSTGVWTVLAGGSLPQTFTSIDTLILWAGGGGTTISGDTLVAAGVGSLQGTTSVTLP